MIEDLTEEKLKEYDFSAEETNRFLTWEKHSSVLYNNNGTYFASNIDKKIYSGIDALRKIYLGNEKRIAFPFNNFPLMLEYYEIQLKKCFEKIKKVKAENFSIFIQIEAERDFLNNEIELVEKKINHYQRELDQTHPNSAPYNYNNFFNLRSEIRPYLAWLQNKKSELELPHLKHKSQIEKDLTKENFETFDELFKRVVSLGLIKIPKANYQVHFESKKSSHNLSFNIWLQNYKAFEFGNEAQYKELLTKLNWIEYTVYSKSEEQKQKEHIKNVKKSWLPKTETKSEQENIEKEKSTKQVFDYSNENNYFFSDKIDSFKLIEEEMVTRVYINDENKWSTKKNILVALIHILIQLKYLKQKIKNKQEKASLLAYRRFFESRYNTKIAEQMKPSNFNIGKLNTFKPDFHFIPEIDKL